jgi:hypothetical protein
MVIASLTSVFRVVSCNSLKDIFDVFQNSAKQGIRVTSILNILIWAALSLNQVMSQFEDLDLPYQAEEAFVGEEITIEIPIDARLNH